VLADAAPAGVRVLLEDASRTLHAVLVRRDGATWRVEQGERRFAFAARLDGGRLDIEHDGRRELHAFACTTEAGATSGRQRVWLHGPGGIHAFERIDRTAHALAGKAAGGAAATNALRAAMPGLVTAVCAAAGERVAAGAPVLMIEAMKMIHTLLAPTDGVVAQLRCRVGDSVRGGDVLATIETEP
jgi:3-methylcrotonyl-CoA carboxylase alpha subunit